MASHSHRLPYFNLVLEGGYEEAHAGKVRECRPAMLFFHPEGEVHENRFLNSRSRIAADARLTLRWRFTPMPSLPAMHALKNLYFDLATLTAGESKEGLVSDAMLIRKVGVRRILYGTDTSPPNPPARVSWGLFRGLVPLTDEEFSIIASNVAPYLR